MRLILLILTQQLFLYMKECIKLHIMDTKNINAPVLAYTILALILRAAISPNLPMDIIKLIHFYVMRGVRPRGFRTLINCRRFTHCHTLMVNGNLICYNILTEDRDGLAVSRIDTGKCIYRTRMYKYYTPKACILQDIDGIFICIPCRVEHITETSCDVITYTNHTYTSEDLSHIHGKKYVLTQFGELYIMLVINDLFEMYICHWDAKAILYLTYYTIANTVFIRIGQQLYIWNILTNSKPYPCDWLKHRNLIIASKINHYRHSNVMSTLNCESLDWSHPLVTHQISTHLLPYNNDIFLVDQDDSAPLTRTETGEYIDMFSLQDVYYIGNSVYGPCMLHAKKWQIYVWVY